MIKAFIFDMDGTLLNTEPILHRAWDNVCERNGFDMPKGLYNSTIGMAAQLEAEIFDAAMWKGFYAKYRPMQSEEVKRIIAAEGVPLMKGAAELLEALKIRGIKTAIATSSELELCRNNIRAAGIEEYFDALVGGDMVKRSKPEPDIFLKAAELLGVSADECVGVEDSPRGIEAILRAEMKAVFVPDLIPASEQMKKAKVQVVSSLLELVPLLD